MRDSYVLNLFADLRKQILHAVSSLRESQWERIPGGFNNHLHWQIGHVLTITDELVFGFAGTGSRISPEYQQLFASGTNPAYWPQRVPGTEVIIDNLQRQMTEICE